MAGLIPPIVYEARLMQLWRFAGAIERLNLADMIRAAKHAKTMGALQDPTLFKEKGPALEQDIEMMEALEHVQKKMGEFRDRMEAYVAERREGMAVAKTDNGN